MSVESLLSPYPTKMGELNTKYWDTMGFNEILTTAMSKYRSICGYMADRMGIGFGEFPKIADRVATPNPS